MRNKSIAVNNNPVDSSPYFTVELMPSCILLHIMYIMCQCIMIISCNQCPWWPCFWQIIGWINSKSRYEFWSLVPTQTMPFSSRKDFSSCRALFSMLLIVLIQAGLLDTFNISTSTKCTFLNQFQSCLFSIIDFLYIQKIQFSKRGEACGGWGLHWP